MIEEEKNQENLKKLILLAKEGDPKAFEEVYSTYYTPIFRYIMSHIKNKQDAEDMAQTVFVKIWNTIPFWDSKHTSPLAFFFTVAKNTMIDYFRKNSHKEIVSDEVVNTFVSETGGSEEESKSTETREILLQAISKLSKEQQEFINLYYENDLTYKEISIITSKREDAIRQIHSRAIKKLRELYKY